MSADTLIHPTAVVDPAARIAPDVRIGPFCVVEGPVTIGAGTVLHSHARLRGPLTMGARNVVHSFVALGDWPQDRKFNGTFSQVLIGDDNIFREGVTVHRGTAPDSSTVIGSRCYLMVNSHVGHNCVVSDDVTLVNGALLAGHVHIGNRAIIGGNCAMHQFTRVGRLAMISNISACNVDMPPFCTSMATNTITQLNAVGLRRCGLPAANINAIRRMFQLLFRDHKMLRTAIAELPSDLVAVPEVAEFVEFCRVSKRGIARFQAWSDRGSNTQDSASDGTAAT
jgi:UDP-N-acetylglucosamine acyltransferase